MKKYIKLAFFFIGLSLLIFNFSSVNAQVACHIFNSNLSVGDGGEDVVNMQRFLISSGYDILAISSGRVSAGIFGNLTKAALMSYQASVGLPNSGWFGPMTRSYINAKCNAPAGSLPADSPNNSEFRLINSGTVNNLNDVIYGGPMSGITNSTGNQGILIGEISGGDNFVTVGENSTVLSLSAKGNANTVLAVKSVNLPQVGLSLKAISYGDYQNQGDGHYIISDEKSSFISTNSINWGQSSDIFSTNSGNPIDIASNNGTFVAVRNGIDIRWSKINVGAWQSAVLTDVSPVERFRSVAGFGSNNFVAVGLRGDVRISRDLGKTWERSRIYNSDKADLLGVTYGNGKIVAVGTNGTIITSSDEGRTWSEQVVGSQNLNAVTYTRYGYQGSYKYKFVVVGNSGTILQSSDGTSWRSSASLTTRNLLGVASLQNIDGTVVIVGEGGTVLTNASVLNVPVTPTPVVPPVVTPATPPVYISCSPSSLSVRTNESMNWKANASGGNGYYTYAWTFSGGATIEDSSKSYNIPKTYSTVGDKRATVTVKSDNKTATASCVVTVGIAPVVQSVSINSLSSTSAQPGNSVIIYGSGFSPSENTVYITNDSTNYTMTLSSSGGTSIQFTVPSWANGSYQIYVENGSLLVSNKVSLTIAPSTIIAPQPVPAPAPSGPADLIISSFYLSNYSPVAGSLVTIQGSIKNNGASTVADLFNNALYYRMGTNGAWTYWKDAQSLENLMAGSQQSISSSWTVGAVDNIDYYFKIVTDSSHSISESNESNNEYIVGPLRIKAAGAEVYTIWQAFKNYFGW